VKLYLQIRGPLAQKKYRLGVHPEIKYRSGVTDDPYYCVLRCRFGVPPGNKIQIRGRPRPLFADSGSPVELYLQIRGPLAQKKYRLGSARK